MQKRKLFNYQSGFVLFIITLILLLFGTNCNQLSNSTTVLCHDLLNKHETVVETETEMSLDSYKEFLTDNKAVSFIELAPGEFVSYYEIITMNGNSKLNYQITYQQMGFTVEVILLSENKKEYVHFVDGGCGTGCFDNIPTGDYQLIVRCSKDNIKYKNTALVPILVSGTLVFNY